MSVFDKYRFLRREDWGRGLDLEQGWKRHGEQPVTIQPDSIVIHHFEPTDKLNTSDLDYCIERVRYWFGLHTKSWCDIAYHYLVSPGGVLFEGRRAMNGQPIQGAHSIGNNDCSFGLVVLGKYSDALPARPAMDALEDLIFELCQQFSIDPLKKKQWTYVSRSGETKTVRLPSIVGHRDTRETECPGDALLAELENLRERVATRLDS